MQVYMKPLLRKLCAPILQPFESAQGDYVYRPSHRKILIVLGLLCIFIASVSAHFTLSTGELGGLIPIAVFFVTGLVCEIVGWLGSDRAVAKIWKSK